MLDAVSTYSTCTVEDHRISDNSTKQLSYLPVAGGCIYGAPTSNSQFDDARVGLSRVGLGTCVLVLVLVLELVRT